MKKTNVFTILSSTLMLLVGVVACSPIAPSPSESTPGPATSTPPVSEPATSETPATSEEPKDPQQAVDAVRALGIIQGINDKHEAGAIAAPSKAHAHGKLVIKNEVVGQPESPENMEVIMEDHVYYDDAQKMAVYVTETTQAGEKTTTKIYNYWEKDKFIVAFEVGATKEENFYTEVLVPEEQALDVIHADMAYATGVSLMVSQPFGNLDMILNEVGAFAYTDIVKQQLGEQTESTVTVEVASESELDLSVKTDLDIKNAIDPKSKATVSMKHTCEASVANGLATSLTYQTVDTTVLNGVTVKATQDLIMGYETTVETIAKPDLNNFTFQQM